MPSQLRILKINFNQKKKKKHMNLDLSSSSSRTQKSTNPKKIIQTQKIKPKKIINEYCTKQNQSTYTNTNPAQPYQHKAKLKLK